MSNENDTLNKFFGGVGLGGQKRRKTVDSVLDAYCLVMMTQVDGSHREVGFYARVPEHHKQQQGYESLKGLQLTCLATTTMTTSSTITTVQPRFVFFISRE